MFPSTNPQYDVFISHAGEDKATIAMPLRDKLKEQGITAFVDEADMQPGTEAQPAMIDAMETARVAVIVLSPEFIARKWPMKELMCFLRRREECGNEGRGSPLIIPLFYRISISELYGEPCFDRRDKDGNLLYEKSRFYKRQREGEPEANIDAMKSALMRVRGIMGVRNDVDASNDSSLLMSYRRGLILQQLCDKIVQAIAGRGVQLRPEDHGPTMQSFNSSQSQVPCDRFRKCFPPSSSHIRAVLDFESRDDDGNPKTTEGLVKRYLLERTDNSSGVVSLHGIGGVGKSTILQVLSVDDEIRERFPDGVHLIKLGKDASTMTLFGQLCQVLIDSGTEKTQESLSLQNDIEAVLHFFEKWFDKKTCAFLIDDVWTHRISLSLLSRMCNIGNGVSGNHVLMTTREYEVASIAATERIVELKPREVRGQVSRRILLYHAGHRETNISTPSIHDSIYKILGICNGLPVSLAVAGKNVKMLGMSIPNDKEGVWKRYVSQLEICREKLLRQGVEMYENLFATLATSISYLDEKSQESTLGFASRLSFAEMYRRLCVLEKQAIVPISMLRHLWSVASDECAEVIATAFVEAGLASRAATRMGGDYDHLSLHDSLHDFAVAEAKRNNDIKNAHNCLLNGYKSCGREIACEWWSPEIEADGYIHRNVCRHLIEAGRGYELLELLLSPQWVGRQLEVNDVLILQADFSLGMKAIHEGLTDETDEKHEDIEKALELISDAVAMSSSFISRNRIELSFQLDGRLIECRKTCRAIYEYFCRIEADGTRPRVLCKSSFLQQVGGSNTKIISIGSAVMCIAIMKNGESVICGCDDGRIFVMNLKRKEIENQWTAHDSRVTAIAVVRDERRVISCSSDHTVKVWEVETGRCVISFNGHRHGVNDITVMRDGRRVISVSYDSTVNIWDIETGGILSKLPLKFRIWHVAVLPDEEDLVVTGGSDGKLRILNVTTGAQVGGTFNGCDNPIHCVAVTRTPDGQYIVTGSSDETVRIWDVRSHQQVGDSLQGHTSWIWYVAVSGDGRRLVSGSHDNTMRVWDLETRTQICDPLEGHADKVTGVIFLDGADRIVSSSIDGTLRVWDVTRKNSKTFTNRHEDSVSGVSFTPDGRFVVSGSRDKTLRVWDTASGHQLGAPLRGHSSGVTDVTVSPNGQCAVSVSYGNTVLVWDLKSRKLLRTLTGHTGWIWCVAVTPDGDHTITGSEDNTVRVWSLATMEDSPVVLEGHSRPVRRVFVSDDSLRVVSVDYEGEIFVWELKTKKRLKDYKQENAWQLSRSEVLNLIGELNVQDDTTLLIQPRGRQIFYGNGPSATLLATMESHIESLALSPDKETICVGIYDGHVGFLNLET